MAAASCAEAKNALILHITSEPAERVEYFKGALYLIIRCSHRKPLAMLHPRIPRCTVMVMNGIHAVTIGCGATMWQGESHILQVAYRRVVLLFLV